jgi:ribosomal protein S27AE
MELTGSNSGLNRKRLRSLRLLWPAAHPRRSLQQMKIQKPKFTLKRTCPNCGQGSALLFLTCPNCKAVIIACGEEGTVFPDPKDLANQASWSYDPWTSTVTKCPHCRKEASFAYSTGEDIQNLGFSPHQYE